MKRALIIRHAAVESLAENYTRTLLEFGYVLEPLDVFESAPRYDKFSPPDLGETSPVIVLGGPLSANDPYPALSRELAYLKDAIAQGRPVLGVCLGAQMMAKALGGTVAPTGGYQFGLRKIHVTAEGDADPVFSKIAAPLVPTLHGECFTVPDGATKLAEGYMLRRDGWYLRINMAFRYGNSYGFQFEPQLTLPELEVWNRELAGEYDLMGCQFDPAEEAATHLREFARYAPIYEAQMRDVMIAFLENAGLG